MSTMKKLFIISLIALTTLGCNAEKTQGAEEVAIAFFDAIYNEKDIKKAAALSTPSFSKEVQKYVTAKNAARRLLNMSFDTVKIDAALGDLKVREEFNTSGNLTLLFTGERFGKTYKELKRIKLIKKDNTWLVDKLLKDPVP